MKTELDELIKIFEDDEIWFLLTVGYSVSLDGARRCLLWGLRFECEDAFETRITVIKIEVTFETDALCSGAFFKVGLKGEVSDTSSNIDDLRWGWGSEIEEVSGLVKCMGLDLEGMV